MATLGYLGPRKPSSQPQADTSNIDHILRGMSLAELQDIIGKVSEGLPRQLLLQQAPENILAYAKSIYNPSYQTPPHIELLADALERVAEGKSTRLVINMPPRHGKLVVDSAPVLCPTGWRRHGDLQVGDYVFGVDGQPAKVLYVSPPRDEQMRVRFSNGEEILVHPEHLWTVYDRMAQKDKTIDTQAMVATGCWINAQGARGSRSRYRLPDQRGVEFSEKDLSLHSYALGVWLGDGKADGAQIDMAASDEAVWRRMELCSFPITSTGAHPQTGVIWSYFSGLRAVLRDLSVFGNKHIPEAYLRSSRAQRLQLLAGLMDTDGHVEKETGRCRIVTTIPALRDGIYDLCTTLGYRPYITMQPAALSSGGVQGREDVYTIGFQPFEEIPVSLDRRRVTRFAARRRIAIESIEPAPPEPGRCIKIDRTDGLYLIGRTLIPTHNTNIVSEIFPAWYLGKYPDRFVIAATYSQELANDFGRKVRNQLVDADYQQIFKTRLSLDSAAAVRFNTVQKGSYFSVGVGGAVTGRGAHILLMDDPIKGREEADSAIQRQSIVAWYRAVAYTRLMPGGSIILIQTRWHEDDLAGWIMWNTPHEKWELISLPALAEDTDPLGRERGEPLWPAAFGVEDLARIRRSIGEREWNSLYQQRPSAEEGNIIKRSYWKRWKQKDANGQIDPPIVDYVIMSFDTGFGDKTSNDPTAITTWGVWRDNNGVPQVILLSALNERWDYPRLREEAKRLYHDYKPDACIIENKQSGIGLVQDLRRAGIPVTKYSPDRDKTSRVHSIEVLFEQGRIWVPEGLPWAEMVIEQAASFPNGKNDDLVDSMTMALLRLKDGYLLTVNEDPPDEEADWRPRKRRGYW